MATDTAMVYRIGANLDELKKNLAEGKAIIASVNADVARITGTAAPALKTTKDGIRDAVAPTNDLHKSFMQVDSILAALGINIGKETKALEEMRAAAMAGSEGLSGFAQAGLAVGAAFAGWKAGRWIADIFDLDTKIGDATARLLGFGDAAGDVAGMNADILAKASKAAGMEIKSLTLAMAINEDVAKKHAESFNTSANRVNGWKSEIAKVQAEGSLGKLSTDLESQNFELKELSERYHVSTDALKYFTNEQEKSAKAVEENNKRMLDALSKQMKAAKEQREEQEKLFGATTRIQFAQGNYADLLSKTDPILVAQIQHYKELGASASDTAIILGVSTEKVGLVTEALSHQNDSLDAAHAKWIALGEAQEAELAKMVAASKSASDAMKEEFTKTAAAMAALQLKVTPGNSHTYDLSTPEGMEEYKRLNPAAAIMGEARDPRYFLTHTLQQAIQAGLIDPYNGFKNGGGRAFANGGQNIPAGPALVGERGPEIVMMPGGASVIPNHQIGGSVTLHVTVNGVIGSRSEVARAVGDEIMARLRGTGMRVPVGA